MRGARWARSSRPGQQHDLAAETSSVDTSVDLACARQRQPFDDDGMDRAIAQEPEQGGHVALEVFGVRSSTSGDGVPNRATAVEKEAQRAPQLETREAEARGNEAFVADR